jgi:hypothetical protein
VIPDVRRAEGAAGKDEAVNPPHRELKDRGRLDRSNPRRACAVDSSFRSMPTLDDELYGCYVLNCIQRGFDPANQPDRQRW